MMTTILSALLVTFPAVTGFPSQSSDAIKGGSAALVSSISVAVSRPDVALMRTLISPNLLKGEVGEQLMHTNLTRQLGETGNWVHIPSRSGPHGIDGIYIKHRNGRFGGIIVGESKYGSSRLSKNQLSEKWTRARLSGLAGRYESVSTNLNAGKVRLDHPMPRTAPRHVVDVVLKNGETVTFWRNDAKESWNCTSKQLDIKATTRRADAMGSYFKAASEGKVKVRKHVYRTEIRNDVVSFKIYDVSEVDGKIVLLKNTQSLPTLKLSPSELGALKKLTAQEISGLLKKKLPHLQPRECDQFADDIMRKGIDRALRGMSKRQMYAGLGVNALKAGGVGGGIGIAIEAGFQLHESGRLDYARLAEIGILSVASAAGGSATGQMVSLAATKAGVMNIVARELGMGSTRFGSQILGGGVGGIVGSVIFAYGGAIAGTHDWESAHMIAGTGAVGALASMAVAPGLLWAASTFGVASTGTAISTLSGAAATSASLAWIGSGGGLLASGTVAAGSTVIGVATFGVGIAVMAVGTGCVAWYYSSYDNARLEATIAVLKELPYYQAFPPSGAPSRLKLAAS